MHALAPGLGLAVGLTPRTCSAARRPQRYTVSLALARANASGTSATREKRLTMATSSGLEPEPMSLPRDACWGGGQRHAKRCQGESRGRGAPEDAGRSGRGGSGAACQCAQGRQQGQGALAEAGG